MRYFFRRRRFKIAAIILSSLIIISILARIVGGIISPQSSILGSVVVPFQSAFTSISNYFEDLGEKINGNEKLAKENSNMTEAEITKEAEELAKTYPIDLRILRRLIRVQAKKAQSAALYDMDYDIQLQEALKIVQSPDFFDLVKNTKTLKELQEEAEQKAAETQEEE